ncbi:hypothetical protein Q5O89_20250 [Peribacillus frigoritolerans]|nr:hypothetical protein [Peribacillus frigoritolerans]
MSVQEPKVKKAVTNEEMENNWIVRFDQMKSKGIPLMFIDSIIPGHQRINYTLIGDTASENDNFTPEITEPHGFQIGMVKAQKETVLLTIRMITLNPSFLSQENGVSTGGRVLMKLMAKRSSTNGT